MSGPGRKRVSKWDSKDQDTQHLTENKCIGKSSSYFSDKNPEPARFYLNGNGRNESRRSAPDDDDEHLKSRQHAGEAWLPRSRVSHDDGDAMMGYYDTRKAFKQDESRQTYFRQSPSRDRPTTRRSASRSSSRSRSRSRSPLQRVRQDAGGSYNRHKKRARDSPRSERETDGRYNRVGDYDWEGKNRNTRDARYHNADFREQHPARVGGRSDYDSDFPEDNKSKRETSDPVLRSHINESARDRGAQRRDFPEGEFHKSSNVPCKFFASGYCRNGNNCRFSHQGAPPARRSPEKQLQGVFCSKQDNNNLSGTTERMRNSHRWNDIEKSDTGMANEVEISRVSSKFMSEAKRNGGNWLDDMEMSPDWNFRVKTLKEPVNDENGVISQSSQSRVPKDNLAPVYEHGSTAISQQDGNRRSIDKFPTLAENNVAYSHHNFNNNLANSVPPVQAFNQNIENKSAVPYQSTPVAVGGSQVLLPASTNLPGGLNSSNPENGNAQNTVKELNHISNISASLAQFFGNGQVIPNLHSALYAKQVQVPEVYGKKEQSPQTQNDDLSNTSIHTGRIPAVTALQINNSAVQQVQIPNNLVSVAGNPKASCEENRIKHTDDEAKKELDEKKTGVEVEDTAEDAENVAEEEKEHGGVGDENNKKEKDPKGMRAFKFALVEIVKELLKPAWKEGGMNKDDYKNIVKKVVDKVTGAIQTGNIPQTQEKIDHYLSASKPKLTRLVQAYISKIKKS